MSWSYDKVRKVWMCTRYDDLQYAEITNFAEYGQPKSPYEAGFDHDHEPDFARVIIEMPQSEVMSNGYGKNVQASDFPIVQKFLNEKKCLPPGKYTFDDLVRKGFASSADRRIQSSLYGGAKHGVTAGTINAGDAAYIHGTVSFALMSGTVFQCDSTRRTVHAEIGAGDDNWDFNSSTVPRGLNALVATFFGPDHYNLERPIQFHFRGPGKRSFAARIPLPT